MNPKLCNFFFCVIFICRKKDVMIKLKNLLDKNNNQLFEQSKPTNVTLYNSVAFALNAAMKQIDKQYPGKYNAEKNLVFSFKERVVPTKLKPDVEFNTKADGKLKDTTTIDYILTLNGQDLLGTDNTLTYLLRLDVQGRDNVNRVNFGVEKLKNALKNLQTNKTVLKVFGESNIRMFDYSRAQRAVDSWYGQNIDFSIPQPPQDD